MDPLEKFIQQNKEGLDEFDFQPETLWKGIEEELEEPEDKHRIEPRRASIWPTLLKVAAMLVLVMSGVFIGLMISQNSQPQNEQLTEIDSHYSKLVQLNMDKLNSYWNLDEADKEKFMLYMNQLDKEYAELKKELNNDINNDAVFEAIISNYKSRIDLVEQIIQRIQKDKENDEFYI